MRLDSLHYLRNKLYKMYYVKQIKEIEVQRTLHIDDKSKAE